MGPEAWPPIAAVIVALITALASTTIVNRRHQARLLAEQARAQSAETMEITDRIARQWIQDLRSEVNRLNGRLDDERRARQQVSDAARALEDHVGVLEDHINDQKPPPPPPRPVTHAALWAFDRRQDDNGQ